MKIVISWWLLKLAEPVVEQRVRSWARLPKEFWECLSEWSDGRTQMTSPGALPPVLYDLWITTPFWVENAPSWLEIDTYKELQEGLFKAHVDHVLRIPAPFWTNQIANFER